MEIGKKLKNARVQSGMTQENVAEKINVSRQIQPKSISLAATRMVSAVVFVYLKQPVSVEMPV